jgi:hypothetical protein
VPGPSGVRQVRHTESTASARYAGSPPLRRCTDSVSEMSSENGTCNSRTSPSSKTTGVTVGRHKSGEKRTQGLVSDRGGSYIEAAHPKHTPWRVRLLQYRRWKTRVFQNPVRNTAIYRRYPAHKVSPSASGAGGAHHADVHGLDASKSNSRGSRAHTGADEPLDLSARQQPQALGKCARNRTPLWAAGLGRGQGQRPQPGSLPPDQDDRL